MAGPLSLWPERGSDDVLSAVPLTLDPAGRLAFVSFSGYQQQEVVIGLLSHASDPPPVRQAALRLFQTLAEDNTDALARYSNFLKVRVAVWEGEVLRAGWTCWSS